MKLKTIILILVALNFVTNNHLSAQNETAGTTQVGPGDTSAISQGKKTPAPDKPHRMLNDALTSQTRDRLQKAMDANPTAAPSH